MNAFRAAIGGIALAAVLRQVAVADTTGWYHENDRHIVIYGNPRYLTDIELDRNETVMTVALGDPSEWVVARGVGGDHGSVPHVFVKPRQDADKTNLEVLTDRHEYMFWLVNDAKHYTPRVAFYPALTRPRTIAAATPSPPAAVPAATAAAATAAAATASPTPQTPPAIMHTDIAPASASALPATSAPVARSGRLPNTGGWATVFASASRSCGGTQYLVCGPISVRHDTFRTYLTLRGPLAGKAVAITTDAGGEHFVHAPRYRQTYRIAGIPLTLFVWRRARECAYAALDIPSFRSAAFHEDHR